MIECVGAKVADISNMFEQKQGKIKKDYLKYNINTFRALARDIEFSKGSFGTGYPFYAIDRSFKCSLPIIHEQIRYNEELRKASEESKNNHWPCELCLRRNFDKMPDLKQICKPCPRVDNELKPRKVINRLPDLDMWIVCENGRRYDTAELLSRTFKDVGFKTSDVNPVETIKDMEKIALDLKNNTMPSLLLPIDAHIVEYDELGDCIKGIPDAIGDGFIHQETPYIPIHPLSLRKTWQKDDMAYNFVHDFLSSFSEMDFEDALQSLLDAQRKAVASTYTTEELYQMLLATGTPSTLRRQEDKTLQKRFEERVALWRK